MSKVIAIIPARGGSKGIPGKNIRQVGGKPLLAWSIEHARGTSAISRVFVSTDSLEIAAVARQFKAEIIQRPPEISSDTASSESSLLHALDCLRAQENLEPDLVVFLQATSPLRESYDIQAAVECLERDGADSLFSACRVEGFVWRVDKKDANVRSFSYDHLHRPRRQDAPEDLVENGSLYIFKPSILRQFNNRLGGKIAVYRMPALHSFQIDEPSDLDLIEHILAFRSRAHASGVTRSDVSPTRSPQASCLMPIRLLVLDFDGVLTDNRVLVREDGTEGVWCSRSDGLGIERLKQAGIDVVVLSKEKNPVVSIRCRKLGIECIQSCDNKLAALKEKSVSRNQKPEEIGYVGNDLNDLECMQWVGVPIAVADANPDVLSVAKWVTSKPGGRGAVREICDLLLAFYAGGK